MKLVKLAKAALILSGCIMLTACSTNGGGAVPAGSSEQATAPNQSQTESASTALSAESTAEQLGERVRVALDNAQVQRDNPEMATRVIEGGTKVTLTVGDVVIPATLNDSITAQDLISRLPYTVSLRRYSHDYCGVMSEPLEYREEDVHYGWLNGDIDFARNADYFTILFEDEENSEVHGHQINIGKVDCELSVLKGLDTNIEMVIELAE